MKTIDTAGIAAILGYKRRYVTDVISKRPDFPKPVFNLSQKNRRWSEIDVLRWAQEVSQAA
jgi:predicted DNA-binding transcriptional regulator AlpA